MKAKITFQILFICNRILFFASFFLPFILLPQCDGPSAEELRAKKMSVKDSLKEVGVYNNMYQASPQYMPIAKVNTDIDTLQQESVSQNKITLTETDECNILKRIHRFLQAPTYHCISGYGIASLSFNNGFKGITPYVLFVGLLGAIAGIFLLLFKGQQSLQTKVSILCLFCLIVFFFLVISDNVTLDDFMWGFWTCLSLSFTNVIITFTKIKVLS